MTRFSDENLDALYKEYGCKRIEECIVCDSNQFQNWNHSTSFQASQCKGCSFVFMNPQLTTSGLNEYYRNYIGKRRVNNALKMRQRKVQYELDIELLKSVGYTRGTLLDVGCNGGFFLDALGDSYERYGTEIDESSIEYCRQNFPEFSDNVVHGHLGDARFKPDMFDIITLRGVIEHVDDPTGVFMTVQKLLKPGGILYICATPNVDSVAASIYRENWSLFHPVQHLWHFSPKTITQLARRFGLNLMFKDLPYVGTPYEKFADDLKKFAKDIDGSAPDVPGRTISPPFFESMMSIIFKNTK